MSTSTIPSADQINTGASSQNYRIAGGKVCTGREEDGSYRVVPRLVGLLKRVGIHAGITQDGTEYQKLECDLETSEGLVHLGASYPEDRSRVAVAVVTLGEGLLAVEKDELIAIDSSRSKEKNKHGKFTCYANVYHVDPKSLVPTWAKKKVTEKGTAPLENMEEIERHLAEHPAWAPRPKRDAESEDAEDSSWGLLANEIRVKGIWPDTEKYEKEYLKVCQRMDDEDRPFTAWAQVPEEIVLELIEKHRAGKVIGPLKDLPKATKAAAEDEYDPFEDE